MHCAMCASAIEKALSSLPGIQECRVNLSTEKASFTIDSDRCSLADVEQAIRATGFEYLGPEEDRISEFDDQKRALALKEIRNRFTIGLVAGLPLMILYSHTSLTIAQIRDSLFSLQHKIHFAAAWLTVIGMAAFFYISHPIFRSALLSLRQHRLGMDVMYGLGMGVALLSSLGATFGLLPDGFVFYDTTLMLATFLTLGRYLEGRAKGKTSQSIRKLMGLQAKTALIQDESGERLIPIQEVRIGDRIRVRPGEKVPVDGEVIEGNSYIDESMLSGESKPVKKHPGDKLYAGTINRNGSLLFEARKIGRDTLLSQIIRMVEQAQSSKLPIQQLADRVVSVFIPIILSIAILTFIIWYWILGSGFLFALTCLISVLVIACPCALGLATPTAVTVALGRGAELGILIKDGQALEIMNRITTVILDKTGTLTRGEPWITGVETLEGDEMSLIQKLASLESHSEHPLGEAVKKSAGDKSLPLLPVEAFTNHEGQGISGNIGQLAYMAGSYAWFKENRISDLPDIPEGWSGSGQSIIYVAEDRRLIGRITVSDSLHPNAAASIRKLRDSGFETLMITGDHEETARRIAQELGLDGYRAQVMPQHKAEIVKEWQANGRITAFVGDGINDAPALAQADVGIAMGSGTDIAIETGQIVLLGRDISRLPVLVQLSRKTIRRIKQNLFWALAYNTALIPIAAGILYPILGWTIKPEFAGLAMAMSSVTVVTLSLMLKRFKP